MWTSGRRAALLAPLLVVVATAGLAGPSPAQKCTSSKLKAAGKEAAALLTCWAKAQAKGEGVDSDCLAKAATKLLDGFAKAEDKGGCEATGNAADVTSAVGDLVAAATGDLGVPGPSACAAAKEKATGKKTSRKLTCHAKAATKGLAVDPLCLGKAEEKFTSDFAKAEGKSDCAATGDAAQIEALVDTTVSAVLAIVQPAATTTTVVSTTTTSTAATTSTTTAGSTSTTTTTTPASTTTTTSVATTTTTTASSPTSTTTSTTAPTTSTTTTTSSTTTTTVAPVSFSGQVQPILTASCAGCHDAVSPAGGLNLTAGAAYGALVNVASGDCPAYKQVLPGAPTSSYLIFKLQGSGPCYKGNRMPPGSPLPAAQIQTITNWILQGAPNN